MSKWLLGVKVYPKNKHICAPWLWNKRNGSPGLASLENLWLYVELLMDSF